MKWLIASDIHGSAHFCRLLTERFAAEQADRLLLLGDLLYHGPRNDLPAEYAPKTVIALLNPLADRILCVRGNCEAEVDQMVLDFPVLADYALISEGSVQIFATHGHVYHAENLPKLRQGDILLYGHTHIPLCAESGGHVCLNPGSVSIPKEGSPHSYLMLENGGFTWKTIDGTAYGTWQPGTPCCDLRGAYHEKTDF